MKVFDQFSGILRESAHVLAADSLLDLKKKSGSNPWPVIERVIEVWSKKELRTWESYLVHLDNVRNTRKDKKYASTYDKKHGGYLRYTLDIPQEVMFMIRVLYDPFELPMTKEFFKEWSKRFPKMRIAEKT